MFRRARHQFGHLRRKPRKRGSDVWVWERNFSGPDRRRKRESLIVGNLQQYPTEAQAWRAAESFRIAVNSEEHASAKAHSESTSARERSSAFGRWRPPLQIASHQVFYVQPR
jgi:hypothetical protein